MAAPDVRRLVEDAVVSMEAGEVADTVPRPRSRATPRHSGTGSRLGSVSGARDSPRNGGAAPSPLRATASNKRLKSAVKRAMLINRLNGLTKKEKRKQYKDKFNVAGAQMKKMGTQTKSKPKPKPATRVNTLSGARGLARNDSARKLNLGLSPSNKSIAPGFTVTGIGEGATGASMREQPDDGSQGPTQTNKRPKSPCSAKMYYLLEEVFARPRGKTCGLITLAMIQIALGAMLLSFMDLVDPPLDGGEDFLNSVWSSWTYVADPGTHADEESWARRLASFIITVAGMLLFAVVVGFVVDAIRDRMQELKRGKSAVVESDHYLILGWTDKSFSLIRELCLAMESEGGGKLVILSERDKDEIEGEIAEHFTPRELCGTKVVCRTGSPLLVGDLTKVAAATARAVVILAESGPPDKADARALRTVLSLIGMKHPPQGHVVVELRDVDNEGLVQIVGKGLVETIVSHDIVGRLMVKCGRQPGLADAYGMFLGFEGDEFYLSKWPELAGRPFGDAYKYFPDAIPVGLKTADGFLVLNPLENGIIQATDEILFLAEDDDSYAALAEPADIDCGPPPPYLEPPQKPERILVCGWRRDTDDLIDLLDTLVEPGSELHLLNEVDVRTRRQRLMEGGLEVANLRCIRLVHHVGNPAFRKHLEKLPLESFTSVLILADEQLEGDSMHSDSASLACLLLVRHIQNARRKDKQLAGKNALMHMHELSGSARVITMRRNSAVDDETKTPAALLSPGESSSRPDLMESSSTIRTSKFIDARAPLGHMYASETKHAPAASALGGSGRSAGSGPMATEGVEPTLPGEARATAVPVGMMSPMIRRNTSARRMSGARDRAVPRTIPVKPPTPEPIVPSITAPSASSRRLSLGRTGSHPAMMRRRNSGVQVSDMMPGGDSTDEKDDCLMICELLDLRTRNVVQENVAIATLSDYILSNNIVSRVLAMVAERREVKALFAELLGPAGQEVSVITAAKYVRSGEWLNFWQLFLRARHHGEILLGYKVAGTNTIITNPSNKEEVRIWNVKDSLVVMRTALSAHTSLWPGGIPGAGAAPSLGAAAAPSLHAPGAGAGTGLTAPTSGTRTSGAAPVWAELPNRA